MSKIFVDDVNVGVKELYTILGIDPNTVPNKLARIYEINPDKVRRDANGNEKTPRRLGVPTKFTVFSKERGMNVTVRYAKEAIKENKNGFVTTRYSPGHLWINGREENVTDDLVHIMMYLHPDCFQSPFRALNGPFRYLFKDNEALAKNDLLRDEQEMRAMSMIIGDSALPMSQLKQIAKGMNIAGVDLLTDAEIKNQLKIKIKANPNKFYDDARSRSIQFNGLLQDVVDKQIVRIISNNGYKRWYFVNEEICVIPSGADEMLMLKEAVTKKMDLIPQFQTALEGRTVESELEKPENAHYFNSFNDDVLRNGVSKAIKSENKELEEQLKHQEDIRLLAEEEDRELGGGEKMHFQRKKKLEKFRLEVDAYKASLQST
jgi:hypothetical protein